MTNRNTKRALLASFMALLLCFSSLMGTTFAWFTDSVTSSNNIIMSGNLDVELYYKNSVKTDWTEVDASTNIFKENTLWEPGHTEVVRLKVVNEGSLALKYQLGVGIVSETGSISANGTPFKVSDYIMYGIVDGEADYTRDSAIAAVKNAATELAKPYGSDTVTLAAGESKIVTMVVYMPETVGNEANAKKDAPLPTIKLGLNVRATQATAEGDSFDTDYDKDAVLPAVGSADKPANEPISITADKVTVNIPGAASAGVYALDISNTNVETVAGKTTLSLDITLTANGATVTAVSGVLYTVEIEIGKNLDVTAVTHKGSNVTGFSYDPITGIVTFTTDSFSPFTVTYAEAGSNSVFTPADPEAAEKLEQAEVVAVDENGNEYTTLTAAVRSGAAKLYFKKGADLGTITHLDVTNDLVIYGNGAYISGGEHDLAVDIYKPFTSDVTITVYNLHGIAVWGNRTTDYTLNVNLYNCENINRIYINGTAGKNHINLYNCTANAAAGSYATSVYSNANGSITVDGCTFTGISCPINLNHKVAGEQTVTVTNSTFVDCATEGTEAYFAPIRLYNSAEGANQTLTVADNTFTYSEGKAPVNSADVLLNAKHNNTDATGTIKADVQANAAIKKGVNVTLTHTVSNAAELYAIAAYVNQFDNYQHYYDGETVKLMNDIDLGGAEWIPIGDYRFSANRFCGTFDGQGYTISNFRITKKTDKNDENKSAYGFFGNLSGIVKNLTLDSVTVTPGAKFAGVLAGRFNGCTHKDSVSLIENCHVTNSTVLINNWTVGGLVGQWNEGTIKDCSVENTTITGYAAVGAIAGVALNKNDHLAENCTVKNCTIVQNGSHGEGWGDMFAGIVGSVHSEGVIVTMNGCTVENTTIKGEPSSALFGYVEDGAIVTVDGAKVVASSEALITAIKNNEKILLTNDIAVTESIAIKNADFVLDGNGYTITMTEGATNTYALFDITGGKATVKNVTFDGIKGGAVIRTVDVELNVDNVTVENCTVTQVQGLFRLMGKSTITNSTFVNNTCNMLISFNYDGANDDPQVLKNCVIKNNTCNDVAAVYYVKGAGATIDGNKFIGNKVKASAANGNGATLYMGFTENNTVTNNVFDGNTVTTHNASKRVAGALMVGYDTVITGNAFINNTASAADGHIVANDVCASVYYSDIDLSGNYWGGSAPVENDDYFVEYPDNNSVIINDYLTSFEQ